jgi:hypothetical protein
MESVLRAESLEARGVSLPGLRVQSMYQGPIDMQAPTRPDVCGRRQAYSSTERLDLVIGFRFVFVRFRIFLSRFLAGIYVKPE